MSDLCPKCPTFDGHPRLMHKGAYRECYQCGRKFTKESGVLKEMGEPEEPPKSELDKLMKKDEPSGVLAGKKVIGGFGQVLPKGTK